jgi:hypothetical protein
MQNLLLENIEYATEETALGTWWRFVYPNGQRFAEFVSHRKLFGLPLVHYTFGRCPETGKRVVARGIIAVGRLAVGVFALGQASLGLIAVGQLGLGLLFGFGQATTGVVCLGQLAIGLVFGAGQVATGYIAIGQVGLGHYVLAQIGVGTHVIDMRGVSPVAKQFFEGLMFWKP